MVIIPLWSQTLGWSLAHIVAGEADVEVFASCSRCGLWKPVDLAKLALKKSPAYSLWNRHPPCSCGGRITFLAGIGEGGYRRPLITPDDPHQTDELHRLWKAEWRRRFP